MQGVPPVSLRLITDLDAYVDDHCSLCLFFHDSTQEGCVHHASNRRLARQSSRLTESSFYTAATSKHRYSTPAPMMRGNPTTARSLPQPMLRHKTSPTEVSLRDLRAKHAQQSVIRARQSDERLQQLYESQVDAYLDSPYAKVWEAQTW